MFGEIGAQSFAEDRLNDPAVRQLAANIVCEVDHDVGGRGRYKGWVRLHLRDGTHVDRVEDYNWGSREKPMSDIDVRHKAAKNLEGSLDPAQAAIAIDNFAALDRFVDLADAIPNFGRPKP
jgi:2-methylcitrate dehydratase PrpD